MMSETTPSYSWRPAAEKFDDRKPPPDQNYAEHSLLGQMRSSSPDSFQLESSLQAFGAPPTSLGASASLPLMTPPDQEYYGLYPIQTSRHPASQCTNRQVLAANTNSLSNHEYKHDRKPPPLSAASLYRNDTINQYENETSLTDSQSSWPIPHNNGDNVTGGIPGRNRNNSIGSNSSESSLDSTVRQAQLTMERFHKSQMLQSTMQPRPQIESCPPPQPPDLVPEEPKIVMRCSKRYKQEGHRVPDIQPGTMVRDQKRTITLPAHRHVVLCTNCQRPLAVHKTALAVQCPACNIIGPAISAEASARHSRQSNV